MRSITAVAFVAAGASAAGGSCAQQISPELRRTKRLTRPDLRHPEMCLTGAERVWASARQAIYAFIVSEDFSAFGEVIDR